MAFGPADLQRPLAWRNARGDVELRQLLGDLQSNILKPHGRHHVLLSLLQLGSPPAAVRTALRGIGAACTPALQQLEEAAAYRRDGTPGTVLVSLALSDSGYQALDVAPADRPPGAAFRAGLSQRQAQLPALGVSGWEPVYRGPIDALLLLADDDRGRLEVRHRELLQAAAAGAREVGREVGVVYRGARGAPLEHFGNVDGRSQPLLLVEDVERERDEGGGDSRWDPSFPLATALVPCPGGVQPRLSFGSFLSLLKLEQDVAGYTAAVRALAARLGVDEQLAGALTLGRFADGTPLALRREPEGFHPVWNNFDYERDPGGRRCPLHAHIRRMNPRGGSNDPSDERRHAILRRGITYGQRTQDPRTHGFLDAPGSGVGLLFLGYQRSFVEQLEFLLGEWGTGRGFPVKKGAYDPFIGPAGGPEPAWGEQWGEAGARSAPFGRFVRPLGGQYFFVPSLSFLRRL